MNYSNSPQKIPKERRAEYNEKILYSINMGKEQIPRETIYNCYTGLGGLHNLKQADFDNYNDFAQAKKEFEMGQFFTPHFLCQQIVKLAAPEQTEMVIDMCCGIANFFNFLPNPFNAYGFDIDPNAVKVARYLYPDANIEQNDIQCFDPDARFDLLLGNPPFNLKFDGELSQFFYCKKAHSILSPAGLMIVVVPQTFMQSEFWDKSHVNAIDRRFSFIGQTKLPADTFESLGVQDFGTKIMVFSRESAHIESRAYNAEEFLTVEELTARIAAFRSMKNSLKLKLLQETNDILYSEEKNFQDRIGKYLFELKTHSHLRVKYDQAVALIAKFRNQEPPENCSAMQYEEYNRTKLTYAKVLVIIHRYIRRQYEIPRKEVALIKGRYSFRLKPYAPHLLDDMKTPKEVPIYELIMGISDLPDAGKWMTPKVYQQYIQARRFIVRRRLEYNIQSQELKEISLDASLARYIGNLNFINKDMESCEFTPLQQHDMNLLYQKKFSLLNWQQGSGKTAVVYHFAKYLRNLNRIRNIVILAPAIAIEMTWEPFLRRQKKTFIRATKPSDLENVRPGIYVIVSISMLGTLERSFKHFIKIVSRKICLIFDESDEITNDESLRTRRSLELFHRSKYKMLATGTTTRNNIAEQYGQLELLYNNSVNMMCMCKTVYNEDRIDHCIEESPNSNYGKPFPPRGGGKLFKACFCPGKTSVFGIEKHNQDIYNKDHLWALIGKTVLTRKFREFAADKYEIFNRNVPLGPGEKKVYKTILTEFCRICYIYFESTGDAKKEAALRLIRQIMLMIRACSIPNRMDGYAGEPFPRKVRYIANMVRERPGKVAIGTTTIDALEMYTDYMEMMFSDRPVFIIQGDVTFKRRQIIITQFEETTNGILICTQQSLKSSVNIPSCNEVILESLQWNLPKMEQFYFRFIRLDSKHKTNVYFVTYEDSIEQNLTALVTTKERLNEFIKCGEIKEQSEIFNEFDISPSLIENLLKRERDKDGKFYISWGSQKIVA